MSDSKHQGFAKLVPGFDFLQNLAKGATEALPQMPNLSSWVAPTLNVEELDKRIQELRAVHFWLEQNSKALAATIQALEVQRMTLATLQGMNCSMADLAESLKLRPGAAEPAAAPAPAPAPQESAAEARPRKAAGKAKAAAAPAAGPVVDPMQWWGSLTQQFQHIAATALQDVAQKSAETAQAAAPAKKAARKAPARKAAPRKPAGGDRG
ncbi:PhaM family polyhydroxyalkanoate granule multifunctional regulatory protein [Ramlibacter sp. MAHUQ-53]|uniref:PhaM family polyhydroxyalkanoate granule multifunctional regulatory protein n=1 Tax=unclassified Ramlibacter TaxID=2617605 RepID=UPI003626D3AD